MARLFFFSLFAFLIVTAIAQSPANSPLPAAATPPTAAAPTIATPPTAAADGPSASGSSPSGSPTGSPSNGAVSLNRVVVSGGSFIAVTLVSALMF